MRKFPKKCFLLLLTAGMLLGLCGMTACGSEETAEVAESYVADDGCVVLEDGTCEDCTEEDDCGCCSTSVASLQDLG